MKCKLLIFFCYYSGVSKSNVNPDEKLLCPITIIYDLNPRVEPFVPKCDRRHAQYMPETNNNTERYVQVNIFSKPIPATSTAQTNINLNSDSAVNPKAEPFFPKYASSLNPVAESFAPKNVHNLDSTIKHGGNRVPQVHINPTPEDKDCNSVLNTSSSVHELSPQLSEQSDIADTEIFEDLENSTLNTSLSQGIRCFHTPITLSVHHSITFECSSPTHANPSTPILSTISKFADTWVGLNPKAEPFISRRHFKATMNDATSVPG